jgi:ribosomal protein RSM22 (predicted rRNA methylase)
VDHLPVELGGALDRACAELSQRELGAAVDKLIARYRDPRPATSPILGSPAAVAAYAAYRMPATWAAVRHALTAFVERAPGFRPETLLDLGGGTGAALWAAAGLFPSLTGATVLDQVDDALAFGHTLAAGSGFAAVREAQWRHAAFAPEEPLGEADLVTVSYVLSELAEPDQASLIARAAAGARAVAVLEPGTPDGYRRVLAARDALAAAGMTILAPCPHQGACPLAEIKDWCHFSARLGRSTLHRRLKGGELDHEDEKFAYVVALRAEDAVRAPASSPAPGRVLRHPVKRKGLVMLQVCTPDDGVVPTLVSKRRGAVYRAARDAEWGDPWPPPAAGQAEKNAAAAADATNTAKAADTILPA